VTITTSYLLRRLAWSNDEFAVGVLTMDEYERFINLNVIWDSGYCDSNTQPLVLREGEGFGIKCVTNTAVGYINAWTELTIDST
jgi:hypothetical protein